MIAIGNYIGRRVGASGPNGAPSNLALTVISVTQNQLNWVNNSTNEDYVIIERSDDSGSYSELCRVAAGTNHYHDISGVYGYLYIYRIRVIKGSLYSAYSNEVNNLTGNIATGLVGRWLFNEGSGATALDSGGANNGTIRGATYVTGKVGTALSFNGTAGADSVLLADILDTTFAGANKQFTIHVRIKPAAVMTANMILAKYYGGAPGNRIFYLRLSTNSCVSFQWYGDTGGTSYRTTIGSTPITDMTKWYDIFVLYNGQDGTVDNRVSMYVDKAPEITSIALTAGSPSALPDGTAKLGIGASINLDDSSAGNFNGLIDCVSIYNRLLTYYDRLSVRNTGLTTPLNTSKLFHYDAGQEDIFVDNTLLSANVGLQTKVNRPVKYSGNPIFERGVNTATWDYDKNYNTVLKIGGTYYMWYGSLSDDDPFLFHICRATSADGITWVKNNEGLVSYGGNTNNNIILGSGSFNPGVYYDSAGAADRKYVSVNEQRVGDSAGGDIYIYKSADGITFTLLITLNPGAGVVEGKDIIKRADGKWLAFYKMHNGGGFDDIGVYLSDSTNLEGAWTNYPSVIIGTSTTNQQYAIGVEFVDGIYYGFVPCYNTVTEEMFIDLYISKTGLTWTLKIKNWLSLGASGTWDDAMLLNGNSLIQEGNNWRYYYSGYPENHAHASPRDSRIGIATIGYKRIINIEGAGNIITTAFTPTEPLILNADLTNGTLEVELLLAADNSVIAGYSKDDMDALSGDFYSTEVKWGGNSIPTDTSLKIKFYLT